jgi:hypothetical protein
MASHVLQFNMRQIVWAQLQFPKPKLILETSEIRSRAALQKKRDLLIAAE